MDPLCNIKIGQGIEFFRISREVYRRLVRCYRADTTEIKVNETKDIRLVVIKIHSKIRPSQYRMEYYITYGDLDHIKNTLIELVKELRLKEVMIIDTV